MTALASPLPASMAQVLAELELISHGRTVPFGDHVTGYKDRSPILRVDDEPYPHELFRARWEAASGAHERAAVLADARAHLDALRRTPPPPDVLMDPESLHFRRRVANDRETPVAELARLAGRSRKTIYEWIEKYRDDVNSTPSRGLDMRREGSRRRKARAAPGR